MTTEPGIVWRWVARADGLGKTHLAGVVIRDDKPYALRGTRDRILTACDGYGPGFRAKLTTPQRHMDPCMMCFATWDRVMAETVADEVRP